MWAVPVLHPAFTFRQPMQLGTLEAHIHGFLRRIINGFPAEPVLYSNPSVEKLDWIITQCKKRKIALNVDVEAARPKVGPAEWAKLPMYGRLRAFGVGAFWGGMVYAMSWYYPSDMAVWRRFREGMADKGLIKGFCNGDAYDIPMLGRYGAYVKGKVHDIRDRRRALVSTSKTSLQHQTSIYFDVAPWKAEATEDEDSGDQKGFVDASRIKRKKLIRYNALDCAYTAMVNHALAKEYRAVPEDRSRLERLYAQQRRLARVGAEMAQKGFPVDRNRMGEIATELLWLAQERAYAVRRLVRPYAKHFRAAGVTEVNDNDLRALLFRECRKPGITSFDLEVPMARMSRTETGMAAVNKDALLYLYSQPNTPPEAKLIIKAIWKANSPLKALSTFIASEKVLTRIGPDGRMHAGINTCGTETGRWSCSSPNLFNLSEEQEDDVDLRGYLPNIRDIYVAPKGWKIVHRDFDRIEVNVMADVTGDKALRAMLNKGDLHTATAREWFHVPEPMPLPDQMRRMGKVLRFACQYHAGLDAVWVQTLRQIQDADFYEVMTLHGTFPDLHPDIAGHWAKSLAFAEQHGYNESAIMKRRRYYPPDIHLKDTETSNYEIQATAADIANGTMVGDSPEDYKHSLHAELKRYFPTAWLAMHTYDSFDVICKASEAKAIDRLLEEKMAAPRVIHGKTRTYGSEGDIVDRWSQC